MTPRLPRMLVVDDEEDFLTSLVHRLRLRGLQVDGATSGEQALVLLDRQPVDVVVLDVRMPGMDGIETLRRIKEQHPRVEVVMLTGHADLDSSLEGMRFGFYDYLTKPVSIDSLVAKVEEAHARGRSAAPEPADTFGDKLRQHMVVADRLASLGELAASIAHEINNPLAVIAESAGWLRSQTSERDDLPPDLHETLEQSLGAIERAVDRASRISRNFLHFARAPDSRPRRVELRDLIAEAVELTAKQARDKGARVQVSTADDGVPGVVTDPFQLRQVLLNLVTNAVQAVDEEGSVTIRLQERDDEVVVQVEDDGPGIPRENLERVFEPFFTTKPAGQGTGLGLAVSRGIVERLGGRLEVDSRPGAGATFRVVLPRRPVPPGEEE